MTQPDDNLPPVMPYARDVHERTGVGAAWFIGGLIHAVVTAIALWALVLSGSLFRLLGPNAAYAALGSTVLSLLYSLALLWPGMSRWDGRAILAAIVSFLISGISLFAVVRLAFAGMSRC